MDVDDDLDLLSARVFSICCFRVSAGMASIALRSCS
jgi:hypothetical protein